MNESATSTANSPRFPIGEAGLLLLLAAMTSAPIQGQTLGPLTLSRAAELALARSPEVLAARAEAEETSASARLAAARFAPQAYATTTPGYSSGLPVAVAGRVPSVFGIEVHKTLYDPARRAEALEAQARAAELAGAVARSSLTVARALIAAYGRNWADQSIVQSARDELESRETIARRVSALAREGRRTDLEVAQAALEVVRAKQALADRESEAGLDRLELARLIDWSSKDGIAVAEDPLSALPAPAQGESLAAARAADPELAALGGRIEALERAASFQKRAWIPTIQAEGQYLKLANYNNFDQYFVKFRSNDWAVGVSVAVPLWTGGSLAHAESAAVARLAQARERMRTRERDLELAVRRAEVEVARSEGQFKLAERSVFVAGETLRVAHALADEGRGELDDVNRGEIAAAQAREQLAQAGLGLLTARAKLLELRGDLPAAVLASSKSP